MPKVATDYNFSIDFTDAKKAFDFDKSRGKYTQMKAIDIIAEFDNVHFYIELKDFQDVQVSYSLKESVGDNEEEKEKYNPKRCDAKWLKNKLKYQFRDSILYRYAEDQLHENIVYICLLMNLPKTVRTYLYTELNREIPVNAISKTWNHKIASSCLVMDLDLFKEKFPQWEII